MPTVPPGFPNASVYAGGMVTLPQMARGGLLLNVLLVPILVGLAVALGGWAFGIETGVVPTWARDGAERADERQKRNRKAERGKEMGKRRRTHRHAVRRVSTLALQPTRVVGAWSPTTAELFRHSCQADGGS